MHVIKKNTPPFLISFGGTVLNTMPIWLTELQLLSTATAQTIGLTASLTLISTAFGCLLNRLLPVRFAAFAICVLLLLSLYVQGVSTPVLLILSGFAGFLIGIVLANALSVSFGRGEILQDIGNGMALGCVVALIMLITVSISDLSMLALLAGYAMLQLLIVVSFPSPIRLNTFAIKWSILSNDLTYVPFFVAMGAYWAFLEIYGREAGVHSVSIWLAASLVASAFGSFLAGRIAVKSRHRFIVSALLIAAFSGAFTYFVKTETLLGSMTLVNAFSLFVFFPLYVSSANGDESNPPAMEKMARYLGGFALGGVVGGVVIDIAGYDGLGLFILFSGIVAMWSSRQAITKGQADFTGQ